MNEEHSIFHDLSVDTGDIDEDLSDESIREKIRDEYLKGSTVTILLVGSETHKRKHVDWELYSSMINGKHNKKSGVLVVNLPTSQGTSCVAPHGGTAEKEPIYPEITNWTNITDRSVYEKCFPEMPARIIDNLLKREALVSVTNWSKIQNAPSTLAALIELANKDRGKCEYDLSREMRRANS